MKTKKAILRLGREKWREIIKEQEASGCRVSAYCRQRQLNEKSFYNWRRRLGSPKGLKPERFMHLKAMESLPGKMLSIQTPGGYRLEVESGADKSYVQGILEVLAGLR